MVRGAAIPRRLGRLVLIAFVGACGAPSPGVTVLDVVLFGTDLYDGASAIAADVDGWVVASASAGTVADEPALGDALAYVQAFDADGAARWSAVVANTGLDFPEAIGWSGEAGWVAGVTWGTLPGQVASGPNDGTADSRDAFAVRFDDAGDIVCLRQFGSDVRDDVEGVAVLPDGGAVVVGAAYGGLLGASSQGGRDAFAVRLDGDCAPVWVRQFGGPGDDAARAVAVADGVLAIVGTIRPGEPFGEVIAEEGPFASAWTLAGDLVWGARVGGSGLGSATGVAIEPGSGDLFVGGWTDGEVAPGAALGGRDGFVARLSAGGAATWARHVGTAATDELQALALLPDGTVAAAGASYGAVVPGGQAGDRDAVAVGLSSDGERRWAWQGGSAGYDGADGIAADGAGRVAVVGYVEDGLGTVPSLGGVEPYDAFLVLLQPGGF